ncbi:unnamed protein product, partial [Ectocarpus fasciculatus]
MASLVGTTEEPGGGEGGEQHIRQQQQRRRRRLCVCTRVHQNNADRPVDLAKVREFLDTALLYADSIAIAVGPPPPPPPPPTDEHGTTTAASAAGGTDSTSPLLQSITLVAREAEREASPDRGVESVGEEGGNGAAGVVTVFEVTPWGKFTPALNALLGFAARDGAELVMFQSLETTVGKDAVSGMEAHMGPGDLVVGAALTGHAFQGGGTTVELTGVTTPWNTLALWDVTKLAKLGCVG